ncbi:MAG TPA: tetratricopeptide repeat protein [Candidatus Krumholzibacterium sp.]|nr:tetratricopeptide repeat protein [Candidatus Krumholzibacterium sp.]
MNRLFLVPTALMVIFFVGCGPTAGSNGIITEVGDSRGTTITDSQGFDKTMSPAEIAYQSAQQFLQVGKYDEAITNLQNAVALKPDYIEAWSQLGSAYSNRKDYANGITAYEKALELSPGDEGLISAVGYNYLHLENWDEADRYFKMLLVDNETHYNANVNLAFIAQRRGRTEEAIGYYETALESNPTDATTMGTLAGLYEQIDNKEKKYEYLNKAIEADPANHAFKKQLARAYFNEKDYANAATVYEELVKIYPEDASFHQRLGFAYSQSGRTNEAPPELEKAVELTGGDDFTYAILAKIYNDNNNYNKAMTAAQKGIALNTGEQDALLYYQWGYALSKLDRYEEAIVKFEKVITLRDPQWSPAAEKEIVRQNQLIKLREAKKEQELYE